MVAVIFDLDGTLVDSQPLQFKAYKLAFEQFGSTIGWNDWIKYWVHKSMSSNQWIEMNNLKVCGDTIKSIKAEIYNELIANELKLKLGALELVNHLYKNNIPLAIASTSRLDSIERIANKFFPHQFSVLQSDVDLGTRKPNPYIFIVTARKLNVDVSKCLVIEDSESGYIAGLNAKMKVVVCPDTTVGVNKIPFSSADLIIDSLHDLNVEIIKDFF